MVSNVAGLSESLIEQNPAKAAGGLLGWFQENAMVGAGAVGRGAGILWGLVVGKLVEGGVNSAHQSSQQRICAADPKKC